MLYSLIPKWVCSFRVGLLDRSTITGKPSNNPAVRE